MAIRGRNTPTRGRERARDNPQRAPLRVAKTAVARRAGRPESAYEVPAFIRADGIVVDADDRAYLRRKPRRGGRRAAATD